MLSVSRLTCIVVVAVIIVGCDQATPKAEPTAAITSIPTLSRPTVPVATAETLLPNAATLGNDQAVIGEEPTTVVLLDPTATGLGLDTLPAHVSLPHWVSDPAATVLAAMATDDWDRNEMLSLIEVNSSSRFDVPVPDHIGHVTWGRDNKGDYVGFERSVYREFFGYVGKVDGRIYLADGSTSQALMPEGGATDVAVSPIADIVAHTITTDSQAEVFIQSKMAGTDIELVDPFHGAYSDSVSMSWSPDGAWLAVTRYEYPDEPYSLASSGTAIYTSNGFAYRAYDHMSKPAWSDLDAAVFLYPQGTDYGYRMPCVLDVATDTRNCLERVDEWRRARGVMVDHIDWLPDMNAVSFMYWGRGAGGICVIMVTTSELHCPVTKTQIGPENYVVDYGWSPDGQYLWMMIDPSDPRSDDRTMSRLATIDSSGRNFVIWGKGYWPEWRPTP